MSNLSVDNIDNLAGDARFGPISETAVTLSAQTEVDFTGIPDWVKKITIMWSGLSMSGTDTMRIQIGDSGGIETSGYAGARHNFTASAVGGVALSGSGFDDSLAGASALLHGVAELRLLDSATNLWSYVHHNAESGADNASRCSASKALTATLDRVRVGTSGSDTFDAGSVNIMYE